MNNNEEILENETMNETTSEDSVKITHIIDNFYMGADDYQYILKEKVTRTRRGSDETYESESTVGYYGSIQALIIGLVRLMTRREINNGNLKELKDCITYFENFENHLKEIFNC